MGDMLRTLNYLLSLPKHYICIPGSTDTLSLEKITECK